METVFYMYTGATTAYTIYSYYSYVSTAYADYERARRMYNLARFVSDRVKTSTIPTNRVTRSYSEGDATEELRLQLEQSNANINLDEWEIVG